MSIALSTAPRRPFQQDWEAARPIIARVWSQKQTTNSAIIDLLKTEHGLEVSPKTLKTRLKAWGLVSNMNLRDAEDLAAAQAWLDEAGIGGILLLRGRVQTIGKVSRYKRRQEKSASQTGLEKMPKKVTQSKVIIISLHPRLKSEAVVTTLAKFESVLREMQRLLQAAKENRWCIPSSCALDWCTPSAESGLMEKSLQYLTWEGVRAFDERNMSWAGLCWKSALLVLETLIWEPDLNIWITFIRCCVRLMRFKITEVARQYLVRLRWLRDLLPYTAPHRSFVYAVSDLNIGDFDNGCLFLLEANLRFVEQSWPSEPDCRIEYQLLLAEEQFHHGLDSAQEASDISASEQVEEGTCKDVWVVRSRISRCMLLSKHDTAERIAKDCIALLEQARDCRVVQSAFPWWVTLADWYCLLGTIQYYADNDAQSRISYFQSLCLQHEISENFGNSALGPSRVHRMLTLVNWLNQTSVPDDTVCNINLDLYKRNLEMELSDDLHSREQAPFERRQIKLDAPDKRQDGNRQGEPREPDQTHKPSSVSLGGKIRGHIGRTYAGQGYGGVYNGGKYSSKANQHRRAPPPPPPCPGL